MDKARLLEQAEEFLDSAAETGEPDLLIVGVNLPAGVSQRTLDNIRASVVRILRGESKEFSFKRG